MRLVFLILGLFIFIDGFGQIQISGEVINTSGEPIPGVVVLQENSNNHTHTNSQGEYSLSIDSNGGDIFFTHILYNDSLFSADYKGFSQVVLSYKYKQLDDVLISLPENFMNQMVDLDLSTSPLSSSQDVLKKIPGLFIAQHAGGGKAEQIFLRGFDIDHGTDIMLSFDGMPVNMVSHAHGQGYSDLHFIIPEVINTVNFGKGSYDARVGNFNTAGYADFRSKSQLKSNLFQMEYGQFNSLRTLGMFKLADTEVNKAYLAAEYISRDGYFDSPQNFERVNVFGKYSKMFNNGNILEISGSFFRSEWTASGQIPERAVQSGLISRFGAIDDTEGGETGRINLNIKETVFLSEDLVLLGGAYLSQYDFTLFSNFTFFLNDPEFGDQIKQSEQRILCGVYAHLDQRINPHVMLKYGFNFRQDNVSDNQLANTINRETVQNFISNGNVGEVNGSSFFAAEIKKSKWRVVPGVRLDVFRFDYEDKLVSPSFSMDQTQMVFSPKLAISRNHTDKLQFSFKVGQGFHSNDTRVSVVEGSNALPKSLGADLEVNWKPLSNVAVSSALWYLYLEQEFVYVGDEGIVEPSGKTQRQGIDLSVRSSLSKSLGLDFDGNYTFSKSIEEQDFENNIPLAPIWTSTGGLTFQNNSGFFGSMKYRFLGNRPANEDFSITAKGYLLLDATAGFRTQHIEFSLAFENLLNSEWNEAQFATLSRLSFEEESIEEIHFTPGTPFFANAKLTFRF